MFGRPAKVHVQLVCFLQVNVHECFRFGRDGAVEVMKNDWKVKKELGRTENIRRKRNKTKKDKHNERKLDI